MKRWICSNASVFPRLQKPRRIVVAAILGVVFLMPISATDAQTPYLVRDIVVGDGSSSPLDLTAVGSKVFFFPADDGSSVYRNLWISDGSESGTMRVHLFSDGGPNPPSLPLQALGMLFFRAWDDDNSDELWKSNPHTGATAPVADISPDLFSGQHTMPAGEYNNLLFFRADDGVNGLEPWFTNGSTTWTLEEVRPGPSGGGGSVVPGRVAEFDGVLYFAGEDTDGVELWQTTHGAASTSQVEDIYPGMNSSSPDQMVTIGSTLFFTARTSTEGRELWKVIKSGVSVTVSRVKDIWPGSDSSDPDGLTKVGDSLFFFADDGLKGRELWVSDGSEGGTERVKDIRVGSAGSIHDSGDMPDTAFAGTSTLFFFAANDGTHGEELWVSDGTEGGTHLVLDIHPGDPTFPPGEMVPIGDQVFFRGDDGATEVWVSDGTDIGTVQISNIEPGGSFPSLLVNVGGNLYFTAYQTATGRELWKLPLELFEDGFESGHTGAWSGGAG